MTEFISAERYARPLEAALRRLGDLLPAGCCDSQQGPLELEQAYAAIQSLREELPTPAAAFEALVGMSGRIEGILSSIEKEAWRRNEVLSPEEHDRAAENVLEAVRDFCYQVVADEQRSAQAFDKAQATLTVTYLLPKLLKSVESDGKDLGEYRSGLTDELMRKLRVTLQVLLGARLEVDLTPET